MHDNDVKNGTHWKNEYSLHSTKIVCIWELKEIFNLVRFVNIVNIDWSLCVICQK